MAEPVPRSPSILTSLEEPPTPAEVDLARKSGTRFLDIDFDKPGAAEAVAEAKKLGMGVTAYHVGPGSADWDEPTRDFTDPAELEKFAREAQALVARGAAYIHLDNVHDLTPEALEKVLDVVKSAGALAIVKNAPETFNGIFERRPDLIPPYALLEHTARDAGDMDEAKALAEKGVEPFLVEFEKFHDPESTDLPMTPAESEAVAKANPWLGGVILLPDEAHFDNRPASGGRFYSSFGEGSTDGPAVPAAPNPKAASETPEPSADGREQPRAPKGQPNGGQWIKGYVIGLRLKAMLS